jgi:putative transposase
VAISIGMLERRKRAEAALISVVATCYLLGVSTSRMGQVGPEPL